MRKINFVEERHIREALFRAFLSKMEALKQVPSEKRAFDYFDFIVWAKAHLARKSFAESWPYHKHI